MINPKLSTRERTTSSDSAATLMNPTWTGPEHRYVSPSHVHTNTKMSHKCDACGETFTTLSRLRLHDCPEEAAKSQDPLSSFDAFLDSISDGLEADMQRNVQEREKRGLEAASETLKTNLEAAAQGDVDAAFRLVAQYERELKEYHDADDYDTYRGILWAFYEPAAEALDEIATREGWDFLADLIDAYPRESPADEPLASPVIENAVGRHVVRTRLRDGVAAISVDALAYLGLFWESMGDVSGEESFTYGWGIGHPEHSVADHLHEVVTEELFWVRGVLPHTFYADQHAAADLLEALLTAERIDYEDRYMLASILAKVDHDSTPKVPRYWDLRKDLDYRFEWDETVKAQLREAVETEGFHERLPENWTFSDMDV
jgi:transcriptional regulator NrdR family protein